MTPRLIRRTGPVKLSFSTAFFSYVLSNLGTVEKSKARRTMSDGAELVGFNSGLAPVESAVRLLHHRIQDDDEGFGVTGFPCSVDDLWRENRSGRPSSPESALSSVSEYGVGEAARDEACGAPPFSRAAWRHRNSASMRGEPSWRVIYLRKGKHRRKFKFINQPTYLSSSRHNMRLSDLTTSSLCRNVEKSTFPFSKS